MSTIKDGRVVDARTRVLIAVELALSVPSYANEGDFSAMRAAIADINDAMRTVDALEAATITISRAERNVILDRLWTWETDGGDPLPFETREQATASLTALHRACDLRDELGGWDDTQASRDAFVASVTPELIDLLRETAEAAVHEIARDRESLDKARAGDEGHWLASTLEETIVVAEQQIAMYENERDVCRAVLSRLDATLVTA